MYKKPVPQFKLRRANISPPLRFGIWALFLVGISSAIAWGHPQKESPSIKSVEIGLEGNFKLGFWTSLRIAIEGGETDQPCLLNWSAPDGEGIAAKTMDPSSFVVEAGSTVVQERLIRVGRRRPEILVELLGDDGEFYDRDRLRSNQLNAGLMRSDELFVVELGNDSGFMKWVSDRIGQSDDQPVQMANFTSPLPIPTDWLALSSVDLMVVSTSDPSLWEPKYEAQWKSVTEWVRHGGALVLLCGQQGEIVTSAESPLKPLIPGTFESLVVQTSSAGAEMFTAAADQLLKESGESFTASKLVDVSGSIVAYEGKAAEDLPLVVASTYGTGDVLWVAVDLDIPPFSSWKSRANLISKLMDLIYPDLIADDTTRRGRVGHLGYNDLSGQLRVSLDQFSQVIVVTFTSVAILVTFFILLIGPGDFWLLKYVIRRMEWTWVTSVLTILIFSILAVVLFNVTKGSRVQVNQAELVDIDATTGEVRGTVWAHVYTPSLKKFDLWLDRENEFSMGIGRTLLTWQGLPGSGLGGMDAQLNSNLMQANYRSQADKPDDSTSNRLDELAIQVASTRPLTASWWDEMKGPISAQLYADQRNNSLHGDLTNPLPYTLDRAVIFYDNWAYEVTGDIDPGETISIEGQTVEKTIQSVLARRRVVDGNDVSDPWDPKSNNIPRILEMMSFYRVAGGRNYTSLNNRLHSDLDWSSVLARRQAVLFARAERPIAQIHNGDSSLETNYDQHTVMIRILLPVEQR